MPTLIHRDEEAVLGALLYAPDRLEDVPHLRRRHFSDPDHSEIFHTLTVVHGARQHRRGLDLLDAVEGWIDRSEVPLERLVGLALSCPDPDNVAEAGNMVIAHAIRYELERSEYRLRKMTEPLGAQAPFADYGPVLEALNNATAGTGRDLDPNTQFLPNGQTTLVRAQENVLAGLIQNPELVHEVSGWLTLDGFPSANRRDIYQAILSLDGLADEPSGGFHLPELAREARIGFFSAGSADLDLDQYSPMGTENYLLHLGRSAITLDETVSSARTLMVNLARSGPRPDPEAVRTLTGSLVQKSSITPQLVQAATEAITAHHAHQHAHSHAQTAVNPDIRLNPPF